MSATAPGRSALTNRQLAQARVMYEALGSSGLTRIQRSAFEDGALTNLRLAYRRLLAEVVEIAGLPISVLPDNAMALNRLLDEARLSAASVVECIQLEKQGWLRDMLHAAASVDAWAPRQVPVKHPEPDLIELAAEDPVLPIGVWLTELKSLISRLRQSNAEW